MPQMRHTLLQNHPNMLIVQRIEHGFALLAVFYKIILPQYAQLMRHSGLAHFQYVCQIPHISLPLQQGLQNADTGRIPENLEKFCQLLNKLLLQFLFHIKFFQLRCHLHGSLLFLYEYLFIY